MQHDDEHMYEFLTSLFVGTSPMVVAKYATALRQHGITINVLRDAMTLKSVDTVSKATGLSVGNRLQLEAFVAERTPWSERLWSCILQLFDDCGRFGACLKTVLQTWTPRKGDGE